MKSLIYGVFAAGLLCGVAQAQSTTTSPSTTPSTSTPSASKSTTSTTTETQGMLTETQAEQKIEDAGYKNPSNLQKESNGSWQGNAEHNGTKVKVTVDPMGTVKQAK